MLSCYYNDGKGHGLLELFFDVTNSIPEAWGPRGEKDAEAIVRNDNYTDINFSLLEAVPQMDDVADQEIAARRYLDFDAYSANNGIVIPGPAGFEPGFRMWIVHTGHRRR
jgi:hypothetical protein